MKQIYLFFVSVFILFLYNPANGFSTTSNLLITSIDKLETVASNYWLFTKPSNADMPLELEIIGENQISVSNLGAFNGIANKDRSIFFKLKKGIFISSSAVFGTDKIKTLRTNLAINSALHFANGATYQFRDPIAGGNSSWNNLSAHNFDGTVVVSPGINTHINGYVSYDGTGTFIYPLGNGTTEYHPLTASGNIGKTITTAWLPGDPSGNNDPTDISGSHSRTSVSGSIKLVYPTGQWDWHIRTTSTVLSGNAAPANESPSGTITISVPVPLDVVAFTNSKPVNLRLVGWNGTSWEALDNSISNSGVITASITNKTFSSITYGAVEDAALPVTLVAFSVRKEGNNSILNWETASETNSKHFDVERSMDGKIWAAIGNILSKGESITLLNYRFIDQSPIKGDNFYRLKMVDADESFAYSRIQFLRFEEASEIVLFPNPVSEFLSINTSYDWNKVTNVSLYDNTGRLVHSSLTKPSKTIDVRQLSAGKYIVLITAIDGTRKSYNILVSR